LRAATILLHSRRRELALTKKLKADR